MVSQDAPLASELVLDVLGKRGQTRTRPRRLGDAPRLSARAALTKHSPLLIVRAACASIRRSSACSPHRSSMRRTPSGWACGGQPPRQTSAARAPQTARSPASLPFLRSCRTPRMRQLTCARTWQQTWNTHAPGKNHRSAQRTPPPRTDNPSPRPDRSAQRTPPPRTDNPSPRPASDASPRRQRV